MISSKIKRFLFLVKFLFKKEFFNGVGCKADMINDIEIVAPCKIKKVLH